MKKIFNNAMMAVALVAAAACQKGFGDQDLVTATFVVETPAGLATKAEIGDGSMAGNLVFAVYPYDEKLTIAQNDAAAELTDLRQGDWTKGQTEIIFDSELKAVVKVTLVKSLIGAIPAQKATAASLGLKKIGDSVLHEEGAVLNGKVKVLSHLVTVEKA